MASQRNLAILAAILASVAFGNAAPKPASKGQFFLYVGNYTGPNNSGIQAFRYDTQKPAFEALGMVGEMKNPSFLTIHPNGKFLYAVSEVGNDAKTEASVYAFAIDPATGKLKLLNHQTTGGGGACHLVVDKTGRYLFVANYGTGSIADFRLKDDGTIEPLTAKVQFEGSGPNPKRQKGPHAHAVVLSKDNRFLFVPDLGTDKVRIFRFDLASGSLTENKPAFASVKPGAGPRHFTFSPDGRFAYVVDEMGSSVTAFRYDASTGALQEMSQVSTLPADFSGTNNSAEIETDKSGRFLYASNRGHNSIAVFAIDHSTGKPTMVETVPTEGAIPRNFAIDPSGEHLLVANQESNNIVVFARDSKTGKLTAANKTVESPSPVCLIFVPAS